MLTKDALNHMSPHRRIFAAVFFRAIRDRYSFTDNELDGYYKLLDVMSVIDFESFKRMVAK